MSNLHLNVLINYLFAIGAIIVGWGENDPPW